jgi:hypothetical protein
MPEITIRLPKPHKNQRLILDNARRFNHIQCGRRFGKTYLISKLSSIALHNKKVGIWFPTYKDLSNVWEDLKFRFNGAVQRKDESLKQIHLITGGRVDFWSMEDPNSGRGFDYDRAILDEFAKARKNKEAWQQTVRPTLTDRKGDAWFLSTPKGKGSHFYELKVVHANDPEWKFWKFTSYDNPYLDPTEIDSAKNQLDHISFSQEYLAEDVDVNESPFLYCFDEKKHITTGLEIDSSLPLWLSFDFNVLPQTCVIAQRPDESTVNVIELARRDNASIYDMCNYLKAKYGGHYFMFTGDASGKNRSGIDSAHRSYWQIIRDEFGAKELQFKLRGANLDHTTSQIICNSVLEHKNVKIDLKCKELIDDCIFASVGQDGKLIKTPDRGLHFLDGFRYLLDAMFPNVLKIKR